jgi:2,3-bisphosphoglycerate-dependent phosphoglycerate mutase
LRDELHTRTSLLGEIQEAARPHIVYTSLMTRAVETARVIANALQVPLVALPDAHEVGGLYLADEVTEETRGIEGPNRAHFEFYYPEMQLPSELGERGWWDRPAEPQAARTERAQRVWNDLRLRYGASDAVIALVTHGGFTNYFLRAILQTTELPDVWFQFNNCAISRIDLTEEGVLFVYLNRFDFMPPELIT